MDRLARVLFINYEYPPLGGGGGNAMARLAREFARRGVETLVLTARRRGLPACAVVDGVEVYRTPALRRRVDRSSPLEMLSFLAGAALPALRLAARRRPQVTCAFFSIPSGPLALLLQARYGIPYVISLRGGDVPGFLPGELGRWHALTRPLTRLVWRRAAALVAASEGLAALARRTMPEAAIQVIPNGIDLDTFAPPAAPRRPAPGEPVRLLFVGRLAAQKGIPVLLEALARLRAGPAGSAGSGASLPPAGPPLVLDLVGDGPCRAAWEALARRLGLAELVHIHGWVDRAALPAWYQRADLFVFPSFAEGMPNALLEALASGLPLVASDIPGARELVTPGVNGLLVPPGDPAALAAALAALLADPARRVAMGQASRRLAAAWSWRAAADAYAAVLRAACCGGGGTPGGLAPPASGGAR
ncbi:MAG: glycosyltransferase family 4 protein [Firmicutes bacterium]|nr:glycosyltransferase family 4 protein [Bacillota bacterium]